MNLSLTQVEIRFLIWKDYRANTNVCGIVRTVFAAACANEMLSLLV